MRNHRQEGFALILAILALMLLTFLGLALATTTTTELQIATNYRWSQQARYNAEAGLEWAKVRLQYITLGSVLPTARSQWVVTCTPALVLAGQTQTCSVTTASAVANPTARTFTDAIGQTSRDLENSGCDPKGGNMGFGMVLTDSTTDSPYQNKSTVNGANVNGMFTVWIRRPTTFVSAGSDSSLGKIAFVDDSTNASAVLTVEGVAPYRVLTPNKALQVNRAVQYVESTVTRGVTEARACGSRGGQEGGGGEGSGFSPCGAIGEAGAVSTNLKAAFGLTNAQATDTGVQ